MLTRNKEVFDLSVDLADWADGAYGEHNSEEALEVLKEIADELADICKKLGI